MSSWVFLRGLTREARHWGDFPAIFQAAIPDAQIVMPDLPGNGARNHLASPTTVGEIVECCRKELVERSIAPPHHLLGLSLGGMVTVEWARRYPQELLACVLINTSMRPFSPFYQRLKPHNYLRLLALAALPGDARKVECAILRMTSARRAPQPDLIHQWVSYREQCPVTALNTLRQLIAAARFRAPLKRPDVALLVLAGGSDNLVDPNCSRQLSKHWDTPLLTQAEAGHDLTLDDGGWVTAQVQHWLSTKKSPIAIH